MLAGPQHTPQYVFPHQRQHGFRKARIVEAQQEIQAVVGLRIQPMGQMLGHVFDRLLRPHPRHGMVGLPGPPQPFGLRDVGLHQQRADRRGGGFVPLRVQ
ncbi:hypothetical protein D9M69_616560 [compost metagenome]